MKEEIGYVLLRVFVDDSTGAGAEASACAYREGHLVSEHAVPLDPGLLDARDDIANIAVRAVDALLAIDRARPRRVLVGESVIAQGWRGHPAQGRGWSEQTPDNFASMLSALTTLTQDQVTDIVSRCSPEIRERLRRVEVTLPGAVSIREMTPLPPPWLAHDPARHERLERMMRGSSAALALERDPATPPCSLCGRGPGIYDGWCSDCVDAHDL